MNDIVCEKHSKIFELIGGKEVVIKVITTFSKKIQQSDLLRVYFEGIEKNC